MSDDLISRQAAIDALESIGSLDTDADREYARSVFETLPSVQSEQKTGRWEHDGGHFANRWICSQCGYKFYFEKSEAKYCPNCGAKMESDNNDS